MKYNILLLFCILSITSFAQTQTDSTQTDSTQIIEEDYSLYADVVDAPSDAKKKVYVTQKIIGLSPTKLISLGFDFVGSHSIEVDKIGNSSSSTANVASNNGTRFAANFPVISNNKMILSLGVNYLDFNYNIDNPIKKDNAFIYSLSQYKLNSYGVNATFFKPFNDKLFGIIQFSSDHNNAGLINQFNTNGLKYSGAVIIGRKPHDRLQYGIGLTRTYRGGALIYLPIAMYNYTFKSKKWGLEILLPARANLRYTVNSRNLLFAGFEVEGNSYYMKPMVDEFKLGFDNLQLHRSEIRPRLTYEFSLYKFIWMSVQTGYRLAYKFNVDNVDYTDKPNVMDNNLNDSYYFNVSINLVSP